MMSEGGGQKLRNKEGRKVKVLIQPRLPQNQAKGTQTVIFTKQLLTGPRKEEAKRV